jgi:hypothetical protein
MAIQIVVAGALLVAWLWVLGRPIVAGPAGRSGLGGFDRGYLESPETAPPPDGPEIGVGPRLPDVLARWWERPLTYRRRQLLLATMFASFGSFFLAIALRGRFFHLFLLMMAVLTAHLAVASHIGSKLVAVERARRIEAAKRRVRPGSPSIWAPTAGLGSDLSKPIIDVPMPDDLVPPGHGVFDQPRRSPFNVAAELASLLDSVAERDGHELADPDPPPAKVGEASEPIFTRPVKDDRPRSRRKAQPIHIHSHLDDGEPPPSRAVND